MEAGKLFQEISIEQRGETINSIGESVANWSTYAATYAQVINGSGSEVTTGDQINAVFDTTFIIRYDAGIRSTMRILYRSRYYNIVDWDEEADRMEKMTISCKRQENATNG
jgi:SPP1 family predicted phage head-tail adaptor